MITLNLISPEQKNFLKIKKLYLFLRNLSGAILSFLIILSIILILTSYSTDLAYELNQSPVDSLALGEKDIHQINKKLKNIQTVQNQFTNWSEIIISIIELVPTNIELKRLEIDKTSQLVAIEGLAKTRNDYLNLLTALENSKNFKEIKSPLENLLSKENISFTLSLTYQFNP